MALIAIGLIFLIVAFYIASTIKNIEKEGIETEGVVFEVDSQYNGEGQSNYPIIRFVTTDQTWMTEPYKLIISSSMLKPGKKVTVIYDKRNPNRFFIKSWVNRVFLVVLVIASIGFVVFGTVMLVFSN